MIPTHADQSAPVVEHNAIALQTVSTGPYDLGDLLIERIRKADVCHRAALEESERTDALGPIDHLVRHDKVSGFDVLLQTANGGKGDDGAHADGAQGRDVGPRRDFVRGNFVVKAVTAQESNGDIFAAGRALMMEDGDGRRGLAPGGGDVERSYLGEARQLLQTGAADDSDPDTV